MKIHTRTLSDASLTEDAPVKSSDNVVFSKPNIKYGCFAKIRRSFNQFLMCILLNYNSVRNIYSTFELN